MANPRKVVENILEGDYRLFNRPVYEQGATGECTMCGKKGKLYDDLCKECRSND